MSTVTTPTPSHATQLRLGVPQVRGGITERRSEQSDLGGTMRLAAQEALLGEGTLAREAYGKASVFERHRHRYEFNNTYMDRMREAGMVFSGVSKDGLVEVVELPAHPWFVAVQFHPEFTSNPRDGHPLFTGFIRAARRHASGQLPKAASA